MMVCNISEQLKIQFHLNYKVDNGVGSVVNDVERSVTFKILGKYSAFPEEGVVHADGEFIYIDQLGNVQGQERQI